MEFSVISALKKSLVIAIIFLAIGANAQTSDL